MTKYKVKIRVETEGAVEDDPEFIKIVEASDERKALEMARHLVRIENIEVNATKIWSWTIERTRK